MINITFVLAGHTKGAPPPSTYKAAAKRFADTYKLFPSGYEHKLYLIDSNGGYTPEIAEFFEGIDYEIIKYHGFGWDIGAHQYAVHGMAPEDTIMCFSSWAHFRHEGWLKAFVRARDIHGEGLYGSTTSFEFTPHIRGTGFFISCGLLQVYPHGCNSREESFQFEYGPDSITKWCSREGLGVWLVTPQQTVPILESRTIDNIFRRGDQSNIWTYDKYTDLYEIANIDEKTALALKTDTLVEKKLSKPSSLTKFSSKLNHFCSRVSGRLKRMIVS